MVESASSGGRPTFLGCVGVSTEALLPTLPLLLVGVSRPVVSALSGVAPSCSWSGCLLHLLQQK